MLSINRCAVVERLTASVARLAAVGMHVDSVAVVAVVKGSPGTTVPVKIPAAAAS